MEGERPQGSPAPHVLALKFEIVECGFSWDSKKQRWVVVSNAKPELFWWSDQLLEKRALAERRSR